MKNNQKDTEMNEKINTALGGMSLYGTTGNIKIDGYEMSGDIENAGQLDKGFKRGEETLGAQASINKEDE